MKKNKNMISSKAWNAKAFDYEKLLLFLLCIGFSFIFYGKTIAIENVNYGVEQLHQYNQELFKNNVGLLEADFSPRYYANVIVSLLMNLLKISWGGVATLIIRLNFVIYAVAAAKTVCNLTRKRLLFGAILVSCVFRSSLGTLAGFGLNGAMDAFIGTGTALVLLAISFLVGEKKNWMAAWIFLALATLMHVHEGMWGGCIVGVIWLASSIAGKKIEWKALKGLPIYVVVMLLVTVPNLLQGDAVEEELFTEIYVYTRTPNHLLPTVWGNDVIIKCLILLLIPALFLVLRLWKKKEDAEFRNMLTVSLLSIVLWLSILLLQYIATVVSPNSTIITMYMPKCFKYVAYIAMLLYLKIADRLYGEKKYLQVAFALFILLLGMDYSFAVSTVFAILLLIECVFEFENKIVTKEVPFYHETIKLVTWEFLLVALCVLHGWNEVVVAVAALIFLAEFILPFIRFKKVLHIVACIVAVFLIGVSIEGKIIQIDENGVAYISGDECLRSAMGNDIYQLSLALQENAGENQEFLADPYDGRAGWVQLISERNCYCIFKCTPSSKKAVIEWYDRVKQVENMVNMSAEELSELMQKIGIQYVLIYPEQYQTLDNSDLFEQISQNKTAAIYKLNTQEVSSER